jgi:hypothetical protein
MGMSQKRKSKHLWGTNMSFRLKQRKNKAGGERYA